LELIATVCKQHGVSAKDSSYVVLRALDREEQQLRARAEADQASLVMKVRNWRSRTVAKAMHGARFPTEMVTRGCQWIPRLLV
jgi:hypothetical protein